MIDGLRYKHVALYASDLRAAEVFYRQAFAAEVLFREAHDADGVWHTLPVKASWEDAERAGIELHMVVLVRDDISLPIFAGASVPRIIGLEVAVDEIADMRQRLPREAEVLSEGARSFVFSDPFDVEWQVSTTTAFRSSGEMYGRWLAL
jgi:hypothetical protein